MVDEGVVDDSDEVIEFMLPTAQELEVSVTRSSGGEISEPVAKSLVSHELAEKGSLFQDIGDSLNVVFFDFYMLDDAHLVNAGVESKDDSLRTAWCSRRRQESLK